MAQLLATKLFAPPQRPDLVPRPHLVEQINRGLDGRLTLVSAPAGSGKTTLLGAWLGQTDQPTAWLSLDEEDDAAHRFFAYLAAALQTLEPSLGAAAQAALDSPESGAAKVAVATLINDLAALNRRVVLVLDDYHVIGDAAIREAMRLL